MGGIRGIENHNERLKESKTNPDIDYEKSHLNKDLIEHDNRTYYMRVKQRIEALNLPKAVRKDAVVTTGFICTSDRAFFDGLPQEQQDKFFKVSHDFLKERYGEENIIASKVHYDETTPHLHTYIVPVTKDGRLSAKEIFTPKELRSLQEDYYRTMRENGFDLERGEGKSKHLSVQEYKVETKFQELKEKQAELEALEKIDKAVNLNASKGKLVYNTQEVDEIKEQNRALKLDNYKKGQEIEKLKEDVYELKNRLLNAKRELDDVKPSLDRLKDFEDENKEFESYIESKPELKKELTAFEQQKVKAYRFGEVMSKYQNVWLKANNKRRESIEYTHNLESKCNDCVKVISDLQNRERNINDSLKRLNALKEQLDEIQGKLFKGKDKKSIQEQISHENGILNSQIDSLKTYYNIEPAEIRDKISYFEDKKNDFYDEKSKQIALTNKLEESQENSLSAYKCAKVMSETQPYGFRQISIRHSDIFNLPSYAENIFKIHKSDRAKIIEIIEPKDVNMANRCRAIFEKQDQEESKKAIEKAMNRSKSRSFDFER